VEFARGMAWRFLNQTAQQSSSNQLAVNHEHTKKRN
jgi:hypothetical protein